MHCKILLSDLLLCALLAIASNASAVPPASNTPGNKIEPEAARLPDPESVPVGSLSRYIPSREAALTLQNPLKDDGTSAQNGERLFAVHCGPCHGTYRDRKRMPGSLSKFISDVPEFSNTRAASRPDGYYLRFIYFGGKKLMPSNSYKLSITEHWDIINYIRDIQKK